MAYLCNEGGERDRRTEASERLESHPFRLMSGVSFNGGTQKKRRLSLEQSASQGDRRGVLQRSSSFRAAMVHTCPASVPRSVFAGSRHSPNHSHLSRWRTEPCQSSLGRLGRLGSRSEARRGAVLPSAGKRAPRDRAERPGRDEECEGWQRFGKPGADAHGR